MSEVEPGQGERWTIYLHFDNCYAAINSGGGDTLLRIGGQAGEPGRLDVESVRRFIAHYESLASKLSEAEKERDQWQADWETAGDRAAKAEAALAEAREALERLARNTQPAVAHIARQALSEGSEDR